MQETRPGEGENQSLTTVPIGAKTGKNHSDHARWQGYEYCDFYGRLVLAWLVSDSYEITLELAPGESHSSTGAGSVVDAPMLPLDFLRVTQKHVLGQNTHGRLA